MAVIITNGNTSLNTASGFYRVEAYNWGVVYTTTASQLSLSTRKTIDVTFANAGNLQGVCLCLMNTFNSLTNNNTSHCDKSVTVWFEETKGTCTITIASPGVITLASHGFVANQEVEFTTTGALPTGLTAGTKYFVRNPAINTFEVSTTSGGASINTSGSQSGTHTCWAIRDSKTLTSSQIMNATDNSASGVIVPFTMTAPYAVDTTASKWRYSVIQGSSGSNNWSLQATSSGTPTPAYAAWCDNVVSFADNDSVIAKDVLTIDKTATLKGVLGAGNTSIAWALAGCRQTDPTVANVANIVWENPALASYTLTIDGVIVTSAHTGFRIGTAASKISATNKAIVSFISPTVGTTSGFYHVSGYTLPAVSRYSLFLHGDSLTTRDTTLASAIKAGTVTMTIASPCVVTWTSNTLSENDAVCITTSGALPTGLTATTVYYVKNLSGNTFNLSATPGGAEINTSGTQSGTHTMNTPVVTTDTTGWTVGSVISVGGSLTKGSTNIFNVKRTIATISGTMITLSSNLSEARVAGGKVINWDEGYGIRFTGYNSQLYGVFCGPSNIYVDGLENKNGLNLNLSNNTSTWSHEDSTARSAQVITKMSCHNADNLSAKYAISSIQVPPDGIEISYCHGGYYSVLWYYGYCTASASGVSKSGQFYVHHNYMSNVGTTYGLGPTSASSSVLKPIVTDNYFEALPAGYGLWMSGYGGELSRNTFFSCNTNTLSGSYYGAVTFFNAINFTGSDNVFDNCNTAICLQTGYQACEFTDNVFGVNASNTNDIVYDDGTFPSYQENSPTGAVVVSPSAASSVMSSGSIRLRDYNDTTADYRSTVAGGIYYSSSGDLVGRTTQTTDAISTEYQFLANAVSTYKVAAVVGCKIANAAYYAGTYTAPTLSAQYSDETAVTDTASASTSQQTLVAIMTPATDGKNISITLSQKTDATGANADVTWSDLKLNTRKYGYTFGQVEKQISEIIPYIYGEVTTPTSNPFITEANSATVAAYTGIAVDDATQTITITTNHTVNELYDYLQYKNALDAGMEYDEYLSTIDGTVYTSPYNIVVSNCALSGAGKTINCGSMDFSLVGTATFDGKWIDAGGTYVPISLTGLVSGSTVYIRNTTDASTIYKAVVSATSLLLNQAYTANKSVTITVRKADYLNYVASTTLNSSGLSAIIAQDADDIYTGNGIDGSTVTEFSLSGSTVMIYVDDPDNATSAQRMYNWYKYALATTTYIDQQSDLITAQTAWSYVLDDMLKIYNQDLTNTLFLTGANINNTSSTGDVIDGSGGNININGYFPFNSVADVRSNFERSQIYL